LNKTPTQKASDKERASPKTRPRLQFKVERLYRFLREGRNGERVGACAPVFLAVVLEYRTIEV
jgi:histone H2A